MLTGFQKSYVIDLSCEVVILVHMNFSHMELSVNDTVSLHCINKFLGGQLPPVLYPKNHFELWSRADSTRPVLETVSCCKEDSISNLGGKGKWSERHKQKLLAHQSCSTSTVTNSCFSFTEQKANPWMWEILEQMIGVVNSRTKNHHLSFISSNYSCFGVDSALTTLVAGDCGERQGSDGKTACHVGLQARTMRDPRF